MSTDTESHHGGPLPSAPRSKTQKSHAAKDRFILRFHDEDQRHKMKARAALNRRTMNAELLFLIGKGIEAVDGTPVPAPTSGGGGL